MKKQNNHQFKHVMWRILIPILFVFTVTQQAFAAKEKTTTREYPKNNSVLIHVEDNKFEYANSHLSTWQTKMKDVEVLNTVTLGIDESKLWQSTAYPAQLTTYEVTCNINYMTFNTTTNQFVYQSLSAPVTLQVTYDPARKTSFTEKAIFTMRNAYVLDVEVLAGNLPDFIYIENGIEIERYYNYDVTATVPNQLSHTYNAQNKELTVKFPRIEGAEEYDLEWVFISGLQSNTQTKYNFDEEATRVRLTRTNYTLPLVYDIGELLFRYRPVYHNPSQNHIANVEGNWSDIPVGHIHTFKTTQPNAYYAITSWYNPKMNWSYEAGFAEDGKSGHQIAYADGLGRGRQVLSGLNTAQKVLGAASIYDAAGRAAMQVMPAPVAQKKLDFVPNLNMVGNNGSAVPYTYKNFDTDAKVVVSDCGLQFDVMNSQESVGAARYYSSNNTNKEGFQGLVSDAEGAPFMITRFSNDGSGRIKSQGGGIGKKFQENSTNEITYAYSDGQSTSLQQYFTANNILPKEYYQEVSIRDQNGQTSKVYKDHSGRVVASMLAGQKPTNLEAMDGSVATPTNATEDLTDYNVYLAGENSWVIDHEYQVEAGEENTINFTVKPKRPGYTCENVEICYNCFYDLNVNVYYWDNCTYEWTAAYSSGNVLVGPSNGTLTENCSTALQSYGVQNATYTIPIATTVRIEKTLTLKTDKVAEVEAHFLSNNSCVPTFDEIVEGNLLLIVDDLAACDPTPGVDCDDKYGEDYSNFTDKYSNDLSIINNGKGPRRGWNSWYNTSSSTATTNGSTVDQTQWENSKKRCGNLVRREGENFCDELESDLKKDFFPGGAFAAYSPIDAQSIFNVSTSPSNLIGFNYTNVTYTKADGSAYASSENPANLSVTDFTTQFEPQWADNILAYVKAQSTLTYPGKCLLDFCANDRVKEWMEYESRLRGIRTMREATLSHDEFLVLRSFVKPTPKLMTHSLTHIESYMSTNFSAAYFNNFDPLLLMNSSTHNQTADYGPISITINGASLTLNAANTNIGNPLTNLENELIPTSGNTNLYAIANGVNGSTGTFANFGQGVNNCNPNYLDVNKEWMLFRELYLNKRKATIKGIFDNLLSGQCASFSSPGSTGSGVKWTSPLDKYNTKNSDWLAESPFNFTGDLEDDGDVSSWVQGQQDESGTGIAADFEQGCQDACSTKVNYWFATDGQGNACLNGLSTTTKNQLTADLVKLCKVGCNGSNPIGTIEVDPTDAISLSNTSISGTFHSFDGILEAYLGNAYPSPSCNVYSLPGKATGIQSVEEPKLSQCSCDQITTWRTEYNALPASETAWLKTLAEYVYYEYNLDIPEVDDLECACTSTNNYGRVRIPKELDELCVTCLSCDQLAGSNGYINAFNTATGRTGTILYDFQYYVELANYLTTLTQPVNLSANVLERIHQECQEFDASSTVSEPNLHPAATDMKHFMDDLVQRGLNQSSASALDLPIHHDYYRSNLHPYAFRLANPVTSTVKATVTPSFSGNVATYSISYPGTTGTNALAAYSYQLFLTKSGSTFAFGDIYAINSIKAEFTSPHTGSYPSIGTNGTWYGFEVNVSYSNSNGVGTANLRGYTANFSGGVVPIYRKVSNGGSGYELTYCNDRYKDARQPDACQENAIAALIQYSAQDYESEKNKVLEEFRAVYMKGCTDPTQIATKNHNIQEYAATLYYYGIDGNLVQTIAPKGVSKGTPANHSMRTQYKYNNYGQVTETVSPDAGLSKFWYNKKGLLLLSQNAKQRNEGGNSEHVYSYSVYDRKMRLVEVGKMHGFALIGTSSTQQPITALSLAQEKAVLNHVNFPNNLSVSVGGIDVAWKVVKKTEVTRTYYTQPVTAKANFYFDNGGQQYLRNRIAAVTFEELNDDNDATYQTASHFSYDPHGNLVHLVQENNYVKDLNQHIKHLEYEYELISGNVKQVSYQAGQRDQFYHQYVYDADNRLSQVFTSKDRVTWSKEAKYAYYEHGPLGRVELGDWKVQGIDLAYNLQGWLKGVNSNGIQTNLDQGKDGATGADYLTGQTDLHLQIPRDVFGYSMHYFKGDYQAIDNTKGNFLAQLNNTGDFAGQQKPQFNGNISGTALALTKPDGEQLPLLARNYYYDQSGRLKRQLAYTDLTGSFNTTNNFNDFGYTTAYGTEFEYDFNGNMTRIQRRDQNGALFDDISIALQQGNNRMFGYHDAVIGSLSTDLKRYLSGSTAPTWDQNSAQHINFEYDELGQLTKDKKEEIEEIKWTLTGKVKEIIRTASSTKPDLEFKYDAFGNRIEKIVKTKDSNGNLNGQWAWGRTFYTNDVNGMTHAVVDQLMNATSGHFYFLPACSGGEGIVSDRSSYIDIYQRNSNPKQLLQSCVIPDGSNCSDLFTIIKQCIESYHNGYVVELVGDKFVVKDNGQIIDPGFNIKYRKHIDDDHYRDYEAERGLSLEAHLKADQQLFGLGRIGQQTTDAIAHYKTYALANSGADLSQFPDSDYRIEHTLTNSYHGFKAYNTYKFSKVSSSNSSMVTGIARGDGADMLTYHDILASDNAEIALRKLLKQLNIQQGFYAERIPDISGKIYFRIYYNDVKPTLVWATSNFSIDPVMGKGTTPLLSQQLGTKRFELTNHLGNVIQTVSDRKLLDFEPGSMVKKEDATNGIRGWHIFRSNGVGNFVMKTSKLFFSSTSTWNGIRKRISGVQDGAYVLRVDASLTDPAIALKLGVASHTGNHYQSNDYSFLSGAFSNTVELPVVTRGADYNDVRIYRKSLTGHHGFYLGNVELEKLMPTNAHVETFQLTQAELYANSNLGLVYSVNNDEVSLNQTNIGGELLIELDDALQTAGSTFDFVANKYYEVEFELEIPYANALNFGFRVKNGWSSINDHYGVYNNGAYKTVFKVPPTNNGIKLAIHSRVVNASGVIKVKNIRVREMSLTGEFVLKDEFTATGNYWQPVNGATLINEFTTSNTLSDAPTIHTLRVNNPGEGARFDFDVVAGHDYVIDLDAINYLQPANFPNQVKVYSQQGTELYSSTNLAGRHVINHSVLAGVTNAYVYVGAKTATPGSGSTGFQSGQIKIKSIVIRKRLPNRYLAADVMSVSDYSPYGMPLPSRSLNASDYRYGFNGMEKDDELKSSGNSYSTYFRQYDPRFGRWMSTDPVKLANESPYNSMAGNPILLSDPKGDCPLCGVVSGLWEYGTQVYSNFNRKDKKLSTYDKWIGEIDVADVLIETAIGMVQPTNIVKRVAVTVAVEVGKELIDASYNNNISVKKINSTKQVENIVVNSAVSVVLGDNVVPITRKMKAKVTKAIPSAKKKVDYAQKNLKKANNVVKHNNKRAKVKSPVEAYKDLKKANQELQSLQSVESFMDKAYKTMNKEEKEALVKEITNKTVESVYGGINPLNTTSESPDYIFKIRTKETPLTMQSISSSDVQIDGSNNKKPTERQGDPNF